MSQASILLNLFGWAMSQPLPVSDVKWMDKQELNNWESFSDRDEFGCILEVDLEYLKKIQ